MLNQETKTAIINKAQELGLEIENGNYRLFVKRDDEKKDETNALYNFVSSLGCYWSPCGERKWRPCGRHSSAVPGSHTAYQIN